MIKLCIFGSSVILGYAGWWLADALGFEFFVSFLVSGAASVLGVWIGWKIGRRFE